MLTLTGEGKRSIEMNASNYNSSNLVAFADGHQQNPRANIPTAYFYERFYKRRFSILSASINYPLPYHE